jgi:microsomal dipeptidase-like Zn-dependent dipeptidase
MHVEWVRRAWQGGLRLMVSLAVNSEFLAALTGGRMSDQQAITVQSEAMEEFASRHTDFLAIARTPQEARSIICSDRLAIVLGVEIDSPLDWKDKEPPTRSDVEGYISSLYRSGIRHVFPIHLVDNVFGGAAIYHDMFDIVNRYLRGEGFRVRDGSDQGIQFRLGESSLMLRAIRLAAVGTETGRVAGGHANRRGLTELGRDTAIAAFMRRGMVIDIDHMSQLSAHDTISIAQSSDYPLAAGHVAFRELAMRRHETTNIYNLPNEFCRSTDELRAISELGGVVGVGLNQRDIRGYEGAARVVNDCAGSSKSLAQALLYAHDQMRGRGICIGSDTNGLAGLPAPRFGPASSNYLSGDILRRNFRTAQVAAQRKPVRYAHPGPSHGENTPLTPCVAGTRVFNINHDGMAHYGLLPDLLQDLANVGLPQSTMRTLFQSAEHYIQMWEKCERQAALLANPD